MLPELSSSADQTSAKVIKERKDQPSQRWEKELAYRLQGKVRVDKDLIKLRKTGWDQNAK